jgi:DNA-binding winged helix-turn-helix (wHTH) protein
MTNTEQVMGYRFGSFTLDLEWGGLLAANGDEIPLRPKSFALLCMLVENAGRILTRDAIMTQLWSNLFVTENNITQCIHDIRRALGSEAPQILQTLPRRGYRFTSRITAIPSSVPPASKAILCEFGGNHPLPTNAARHRKDELQL